MNSGRHILSQILDLVDRKTLSRLVERYDAEPRVRHFGWRALTGEGIAGPLVRRCHVFGEPPLGGSDSHREVCHVRAGPMVPPWTNSALNWRLFRSSQPRATLLVQSTTRRTIGSGAQ